MSEETALRPGLTGEATATVTEALTAIAFGTGSVRVWSSAGLVALLEAAAVAALDGALPPGRTTVGTRLDVRHTAATPLGMVVTARATLQEIDGRRLVFAVEAWDAVEPVGAGVHERFIVDAARFEARAAAKLP